MIEMLRELKNLQQDKEVNDLFKFENVSTIDGSKRTTEFSSDSYLPDVLDHFKRFLLSVGYGEELVDQYLCDYGDGVTKFPVVDDTAKEIKIAFKSLDK